MSCSAYSNQFLTSGFIFTSVDTPLFSCTWVYGIRMLLLLAMIYCLRLERHASSPPPAAHSCSCASLQASPGGGISRRDIAADVPPVGVWKWKGVGAGRGVCAGGGWLWAWVGDVPPDRFTIRNKYWRTPGTPVRNSGNHIPVGETLDICDQIEPLISRKFGIIYYFPNHPLPNILSGVYRDHGGPPIRVPHE